MQSAFLPLLGAALLGVATGTAGAAGVQVIVERHDNETATPGFKFEKIPPPRKNDAAASARFTLVDGERDRNGASLEALHDGKVPLEEDQPGANFFFRPGAPGGRILVDLGRPVEISAINTYSWHPANRGPQVYHLYGAEDETPSLNLAPKTPASPEDGGWTLIAKVDSRAGKTEEGGQHAVSVAFPSEAPGKYRFLLFHILPTHATDYFAQTFFGEIDVVDARAAEPAQYVEASAAGGAPEIVETADGRYRISIDTSETPDLAEWVRTAVVPMAREWYPKLAGMLASEGFEAPRRVSIVFSASMEGVAATGGSRVRCAARWFRGNLQGEALGAVFHELVHVVQQYGRARRTSPNAAAPPGWLVEGLADYIRWYRFEPQSRGAEIAPRNVARARYDASYRVSANFINYVAEKYDRALPEKLNAAMREGKYEPGLWEKHTGRTLSDLGAEWKTALEEKAAPKPAASPAQSHETTP